MIEGLKVTVPGPELKQLCEGRAQFHEDRTRFYEQQKEALPDIDESVPQFSNVSKQPQEMMWEHITKHKTEAAELKFIAAHLDMNETYMLGREDLFKLGITPRDY